MTTIATKTHLMSTLKLTLFSNSYHRYSPSTRILSLRSPQNAAVSQPNPAKNSFASLSSSAANNSNSALLQNNDAVVSSPVSNAEVNVVLLGWLGAKERHVRKYEEWYRSRGFNAVSFVVGVKEVSFGFDLGKSVEERVNGFARELECWVLENERRGLVFHTFSNTGWLVYGNMLDIWMGRKEILNRIKGCIVDSGGGSLLDPRVWAAGFAAALLKKRSSSAYASAEDKNINGSVNNDSTSKMQDKEPLIIEMALLFVLEKLFSFILKLPDVDLRLKKIVSILLNNQPSCPQLYLYSTADKVIPFQSVESLIEQQRKMGRTVRHHNFCYSPHVDHYRTYPDAYSSKLHCFLNECFRAVKEH